MKTSELTGAALDWAVAKAGGLVCDDTPRGLPNQPYTYKPSTDWAIGGPIIERERISVVPLHHDWEATIDIDEGDVMVQINSGPTPLIAAMRCFVASKLGDEVDLPKELT